jgi:hypothetical protein
MMRKAVWMVSLALLTSPLVFAQSGASRPDPADPKASVPVVTFRSAFTEYRGWREEKLSDWHSANDVVGEIGGWRVYLREAHQPDPGPARQSPQQPPKPAPASKP